MIAQRTYLGNGGESLEHTPVTVNNNSDLKLVASHVVCTLVQGMWPLVVLPLVQCASSTMAHSRCRV